MKKLTVKFLSKCPKRDNVKDVLYILYYGDVVACKSAIKLDCYKVIKDMVSLDSHFNDPKKFQLFKVSKIKMF